ncbi:hypothetical protein PJK54_01925 [Cobetia sp. MMG027]|nr:hypothetical protein [Cobetia sp. MMG027]MDA5562428.1 hypothetical protein [Cobetia sp. MMG027]
MKKLTDDDIKNAIIASREWQGKNKTFVPSYYYFQNQADASYR